MRVFSLRRHYKLLHPLIIVMVQDTSRLPLYTTATIRSIENRIRVSIASQLEAMVQNDIFAHRVVKNEAEEGSIGS